MAAVAKKKLEHFSHQHALTLVKTTTHKGKSADKEKRPYNLRCFGCTQKISKEVPYYRCEEEGEGDCRFFFLHQACADVAMTPDMSGHDPNCAGDIQLKKYPRPDQSNQTCNSCDMSCYRFTYVCSECEYLECLTCALTNQGEFKLSFHQHPVHWYGASESDETCSVCSLSLPTFTRGGDLCYGCRSCDFVVHPHCTDVPLQVQASSHPHHQLQLCFLGQLATCRICVQEIDHTKELAYSCGECEYYTHAYDYFSTTRYKELQRSIIHEHLLLLVEEEEDWEEEEEEWEEESFDTRTTGDDGLSTAKECSGCRQIISWGPYYMCAYCKPYYLHKLCAEIPEQIEHQMHRGCTLDLHEDLQSPSPLERRCGVCNVECNGIVYYCSSCDYSLDIVCALMEIKFNDKDFHPQHPLVLSLAKGPLSCHACDKDHEGVSYECNTCQFWAHESCTLLASMKQASSQDHEHDLYLIYSIPDKFSDVDVYCQICTKYMKHHNWAYYCYRCRYFTHVYDCTNWNRDKVTIDPTIEVMDLPLPGELILDKKVLSGATIKHPRNPMILFTDQVTYTDLGRSITNLMRGPQTWSTYLVDEKHYNGSTFTFYNGKLVVHFTNVDLPRYIKHEGHPHVLQSTFLYTFTRCNACEHSFTGWGYSCTACAFTIHTYCTLLPGKIKHGYDKHPFLLTYSSIEGIEEYICEFCEGDVIPKWFYHCEDCDQSIHARCIWKAYKKFEGFFTFHLHECNLTLVPPSNDLPKCIICRTQETFGHGFAYLCTEHDFMVHLTCTFHDEVYASMLVSKLPHDKAEVESDKDLPDNEDAVPQNDEALSQD